jgi:hypothetical protein
MDASRRFGQLSRQQMREGDLAGSAQALGMSERLAAGGFMPMSGRLPMMPRDAGMPMGQPMGPLPAPMSRPMMPPTLDAMSGQPVSARNAPMPAPMPMTPPEPEPVNPFAMTPLGTYVDPTAAMVPDGFNAMNELNAANGLPMPPPGLYGPEAAPLAGVMRLPGTDYGMVMKKGEPVGSTVPLKMQPEPLSFAPVPGTDLMMPRGQGADRLPMMQNRGTIEGPRPTPDTMGPMPGQPNLQPVGPSGSQKPAAMPKFQTDDEGRYFWFEPNGQGGFRRKFVDADGDGKPDVAPGAGSAKPALASGAVPKGTTAKGAAWSLFQP